MGDHVANRLQVYNWLREELVGPSPQGKEIDCSGEIVFSDKQTSYGPWKQAGIGEEILLRDSPTVRYGVGVLYPKGILADEQDTSTIIAAEQMTDSHEGGASFEACSVLSESFIKSINEIQERSNKDQILEDTDDFDLLDVNSYKPSSMGISFLAEFKPESKMVIKVTGGRYRKKKIKVEGEERIWWLRSPVAIVAEYGAADCMQTGLIKSIKTPELINCEGLDLRIEVYSRKTLGDSNLRLLTVCIVNRTETPEMRKDEFCLFQSYFEVTVFTQDGKGLIHPYPRIEKCGLDPEEESLDLLYKSAQTYAIGHGCAADWEDITHNNCVLNVSAECLPICEVPSVTPDIIDKNGNPVEVSMAELAGIIDDKDGFDSLATVINLYENWIDEKQEEIKKLDNRYQGAATNHLKECQSCLERMREGFEYLQKDTNDGRIALRAFKLMNYAMLMQQANSRIETRKAIFDTNSKEFHIASFVKPDYRRPSRGLGNWRAFQIGFLLMSMRSAIDELVPDRETVDLIWFPTGGGKTEAYLGLAAFSMLVRRLKNPADAGVNVLMRYTLRLLTTQQFQRAASLICAMETIRRENSLELGDSEFSIGIWLGGDTTPNTRKKAKQVLHNLQRKSGEENAFIIDRCPWCGAQMGKNKDRRRSKIQKVIGYEESADTVVFKCIDHECPFHNKLPVYVIDEDIYEYRPSIIIGTIDKFAMLPWRPEARAIFGIDEDGTRFCSPPGIIIQDELHLISGPIGSLAGLYETVVEQLCTDNRKDPPIPPKIICSTATIRRYKQQILYLYSRNKVMLYPPPGLDVSDSFFSRYDTYPDGQLRPGRQYVGVHAPGLGSMQTVQVRTFSTLLQAPVQWDKEDRDPWWTLLVFFNSLRELGTTVSLFQSDIPDYLKVIRNRVGIDYSQMRWLNVIKELTGRLPSDQIPEAIEELKIATTRKNGFPIDACLASNIIEVGIDIDRLSLMAIVGQPKTTAQYIQVSGRVGRKSEKPGLVITLYSASKPRDRSHFEKFRSYHQRLYAQVEPTSVTPFSAPALERALHAVFVAYVRQTGAKSGPDPFPEDYANDFEKLLLNRVAHIDPSETRTAEKILIKRFYQWRRWMPLTWSDTRDENIPLLRRAGAYADPDTKSRSWSTLMSMRNVDVECNAQIMLPPIDEEEI